MVNFVMNMGRLINKDVTKMKVKDLKKALENADDEQEIILCFNMKDKGVHYVYLAEVLCCARYDGVLGEILNEGTIVELNGFADEYSRYVGDE